MTVPQIKWTKNNFTRTKEKIFKNVCDEMRAYVDSESILN